MMAPIGRYSRFSSAAKPSALAGPAELVGDTRAHLGESPRWLPDAGCLAWVDLWGGTLLVTDPSTGATTRIPVGSPLTSVVPAAVGLLLTRGSRLGRLVDGAFVPLTRVLARPGGRCNDSGVDPSGRVLVGTMGWTAADPLLGDVARIDAQGVASVLLEGLGLANGLAWNRDGSLLWVVDTKARSVSAYRYDALEASLGAPALVVDLSGMDGVPDGLAVDAQDHLWVCLHGAGTVLRIDPGGRPVGAVHLPVPGVTACAFGGERLDQLFVTTGRSPAVDADAVHPLTGSLFVVDPQVCGLPLRLAEEIR
ncbi:MAG: SMP-30/gluconolactonase/LRE family protein [Motilibacteraceae bacterium]